MKYLDRITHDAFTLLGQFPQETYSSQKQQNCHYILVKCINLKYYKTLFRGPQVVTHGNRHGNADKTYIRN
jgi:hypothetical protein